MTSGERNVEVQVEDDADGFLGLVPAPDDQPNNHGHFAEQVDDKLEINVDGDNLTFPNGSGVNPDSEYYIDNVFEIQNYGPNGNPSTGEIKAWISENTVDRVGFYVGGDETTSAESKSSVPNLSPSATYKVGMYIDATDLDSSDTIDGEVVISAEDQAN
jgi:hypothetical protein